MGQTLENGVYLPSEGERNCYAGLKTNWEILDQKVADVTALQQAVAGALHREIVESLPTTDINPNTIYMVLSGTSATENVYNEYMYVNNAWELIGTSATDLTNYYTKAEVDGKLLLKANDSDVVHKSGDETISGNKTFSSNVNVYNSDSATDTANIILKNSKIERGSTTNIGEQTIFFLDKDNAQIGNIKCEVDSYGASTLSIQCTNPSNSSSGIRLRRTSAGTFLQPTFNSGCNLGTSGYRWYDVQTRAVNNLEPSSLSMPDLANGIDISSYINASQTSTNNYTPPANGWISITITTSSRGSIQIECGSGFRSCVYSCTDPDNPSDFIASIIIPCVKNDTVTIYFRSSSGGTIKYAKFFPCQGNV